MIDPATREWIEHVHRVDNDVYERYARAPGANVATYSFTPNAEHVTDAEVMSYHEWPEFDMVDFLCIRYELSRSDFPFHYLRFWTQKLRPGGHLLVFSPKRSGDWISPEGLECFELYLRELGFALSESPSLAEDYWAAASLWRRDKLTIHATSWRKIVSVHAGCIAFSPGTESHGVLLAGPHGVGKTSLVIRLLREGVDPRSCSSPGASPESDVVRPCVRFVADAWIDVIETSRARGMAADGRPLRLRKTDLDRWGLPSPTGEEGKSRWAIPDLVSGADKSFRVSECVPSVILWPTLSQRNAQAHGGELGHEHPYTPFAADDEARRRERLAREGRLVYLGHNLPDMRQQRDRAIAWLAGLPHYDVFTPGFDITGLRAILAETQ